MSKFILPEGTCDTHHHIYNPKEFGITPLPWAEWDPNKPTHLAEEYACIAKKSGITRNIVQATTPHGFSWGSDLDAVQKLGKDNTRAILMMHGDVSDSTLADLNEKGVRGARVLPIPKLKEHPAETISLAPRFAELKWNLDFTFATPKDVEYYIPIIEKLPCEVVISHQAFIMNVNDPNLEKIINLLKDHKVWVKLSGIYHDGNFPPKRRPPYEEALAVGYRLIEAAPERLLWGTDWPHNWTGMSPTVDDDYTELKYDTGSLIELVKEQIPSEDLRQQILVDNPAKLYGFK